MNLSFSLIIFCDMNIDRYTNAYATNRQDFLQSQLAQLASTSFFIYLEKKLYTELNNAMIILRLEYKAPELSAPE